MSMYTIFDGAYLIGVTTQMTSTKSANVIILYMILTCKCTLWILTAFVYGILSQVNTSRGTPLNFAASILGMN